jgi:phage gp45-like
MMPDYTIKAENPTARVTISPDGRIIAEADAEVRLMAPAIILEGNTITMGGLGGGAAAATLKGDINQDGSHTSSGDQVAGGVSQISHPHSDAGGSGNSGPPIAG